MAPEHSESFGQRLRRLRLAASLSQEALAERAGLTAAAVGALERGDRRYPFPHTVRALAQALGLSDADQRDLYSAVPSRGRAARERASGDGHTSADRSGWEGHPPAPLTPIVGREWDIATVRVLLRRPEVRLLTVTGPGGVGKTRLALEIANRAGMDFAEGARWVGLGGVTNPDMVLEETARALGLPEERDAPVIQRLVGYLKGQEILLVLDNMEHLLNAGPALARLLEACPGITLLATSRERLRIRGEHEVQLRPLGLPREGAESAEDIGSADAVKLLVARAAAVRPGFGVTGENARALSALCRRLDGLPLALELVAGQLKLISPAEVLERLATGKGEVAGGARDMPVRHQSLDLAIEWSHALLDPGEKALFRRLAVFVGGFTAGAAERVCSDGRLAPGAIVPVLASLVDKSLLQALPGQASRFGMLETVRDFAARKLRDSGEEPGVRSRHAAFFAGLAEEVEPEMQSGRRDPALGRLDLERKNLAAALEWSAGGGDVCVGLCIAGALAWYWIFRGAHAEARSWTAQLLERPHNDCEQSSVGRALAAACAAEWKLGRLDSARLHAEESVAVLRGTDNRRWLALALALCGLVAVHDGRPQEAVPRHEESLALFEGLGHRWGMAYATSNLGDACLATGEPGAARDLYQQSLEGFRQANDHWGEAIVLHTLGNVALREGSHEMAVERYTASVALCRELGNRMEAARGLLGLAAAALAMARLELAESSLTDSLAAWQDFEDADGIAMCMTGLAAVAAQEGQGEKADRLLKDARKRVAGRPRVYMVDPGIFDAYLGGLQG
ncbi:MAG: helix-turn-helix domain-containing protein [Chloroflexi bacterium CFX7]|nr:helix-turn-helix domain-containing protein [Chloroflexi bacterium CFX7]